MKHDTQHLDYLISQYVDGCLDPASRKSLEQQLVNNPAARQLYKGHRDVQEMLDDWGNRIPMIDWAEFDKKLARRLENEVVGSEAGGAIFRRLRPLAAAAALLLAVGLGYTWRAWSTPPASAPVANVALHEAAAPAGALVIMEDGTSALRASKASVEIPEAPRTSGAGNLHDVALVAPDSPAGKPLADALRPGPISIERSAIVDTSPHGSVSARIPPASKNDQDSKDPGPAFP